LRYRDVIKQLFVPNVACVLSNGSEAVVGSYNSGFKFFKAWYRSEEHKDNATQPSIKQLKSDKTTPATLRQLILSFCKKATLIDFIENFVLYERATGTKIIAQNHQYLGVNNALGAYEQTLESPIEDTNILRSDTELDADFVAYEQQRNQIGTFFHTQGSGKSYSMVFFAEKLRRKYAGDFTFLIITDRQDLDKQLYNNYVRTGAIGSQNVGEQVRPSNSRELRAFLQANKRYIFTLIQKFRPEQKGEAYPVLSERSDIIVLVDEAHRSQYAVYAENMRIALPNAKFIAFTGTPLLGKNNITARYFGKPISIYDFSQSVEDGATVPLYYNRNVPKVKNENENLTEEYENLLLEEDLTDEQIMQLERTFAREYEVLRRDDRLETNAKHIVTHFSQRGYLGKGMVIGIDKYMAVVMHKKVEYHWLETIKQLTKDLKKAKTSAERTTIETRLRYMKSTEMAVVVSAEDGEEEKFEAKGGLSIEKHRKRMVEKDVNGLGIEENFKDDNHPLRLVFVCAMWLTGFDVPTLSTLYLDKPMELHNLMQTIARANRVSSHTINDVQKINGEIVDYYGVFRKLKEALGLYGNSATTDGVQAEAILDNLDILKTLLDAAFLEIEAFCANTENGYIGFDVFAILNEKDALLRSEALDTFTDNILVNDERKKGFIVHENLISNLYAACKFLVLKQPIYKQKAEVLAGIRNIIDRKRRKDETGEAASKLTALLDESILVQNASSGNASEPKIEKWGLIDLSKMDMEKIRQEFRKTKHKNIAIQDIRAFIAQKLAQLLAVNPTRTDFLARYDKLIEGYNEGHLSIEALEAEFAVFIQNMAEEEKRHIKEGLTEQELIVFDLLEQPKLSPTDRQAVKDTARALLDKLTNSADKLLVVDWQKDEFTRLQIENAIRDTLNKHLPQNYERMVFTEKFRKVYDFIYTDRSNVLFGFL
jgi:type I restriction enzyme, R subunit